MKKEEKEWTKPRLTPLVRYNQEGGLLGPLKNLPGGGCLSERVG
jgi:hypothetical protein